MEYQKIINFLRNETTQPSKFKTKLWVEITDDSVEYTQQMSKLIISVLSLDLIKVKPLKWWKILCQMIRGHCNMV